MHCTRALCLALILLRSLAWGQEDLTRPFEPDGATVALYHLDDAATGRLRDAAGGPTGAAVEALPTFGRFSGGLSFGGGTGWADIPAPADVPPEACLTVEAWVKFRQTAGGDVVCRNGAYMLRVSSSLRAYVHLDGKWRQVEGRRPVPVGRWTHLAVVYDAPSRQVRCYVDGRLDVAAVPDGLTDGRLGTGDRTLRLGSNTWTPQSGLMDGKLDEVRISSVARTYEPLQAEPAQPLAPGGNLLVNPGFEFGLHGWRTHYEADTRLQWTLQTENAPQGRAFLRSAEPGRYAIITYPFPIALGEPHTVSALLRADRACKSRFTLTCAGAAFGSDRPSKSASVDVTTGWQRLSAALDLPADWPTRSAYLAVDKPQDVTLDLDAVNVVCGEERDYSQTQAQSVGILADLPPQSTYDLGGDGALPLQVVNAGDAPRRLTVGYEVSDRTGRTVARGELPEQQTAPGDASPTRIALPTTAVGWFLVQFTLSEGDRELSRSSRVLNVVEPMAGLGDALSSPLGMNTHMEREATPHLDRNLSALARCGVKWIRGWWGWGMAGKQPGDFDWAELDRQLGAVNRAGMELMPILLRYYPAYEQAWAGKTDRIQQPPYDLAQWSAFVARTVERYRGRVRAWEVWNEPAFTMEADEYARILKATYEAVKSADPDALVVGFAGVPLDYVRKVFEAGGADCLDVLSHHSYAQLPQPFQQMSRLAEDTDAVLKQFGATPRVWHSEQGQGADGLGYVGIGLTETQCAAGLVQAYLSALATGVEKFFWFSAQTSPTYGWAVFYEDYTPRPRLVALNGLARLLRGRRVVERLALPEGAPACVLLDGEAGAAAALWNLGDNLLLRLPDEAGALRALDLLANPLPGEGGAAPRELALRSGQPLYLLAPGLSLRDLAALLRRATFSEEFPVQVSARKTDEGSLEVTVTSLADRCLDLRVGVTCPELFAAPPEPIALVDLPGGEGSSLAYRPDRAIAAGRDVEAKITVELGEHGLREHEMILRVRF